MTPTACPDVRVVWSGGIARGFALCFNDIDTDPLAYVQGTGTKRFLKKTATTRTVNKMLDVADDGTATYLLYVSGGKAPQVRLLSRSRSGTVKDQLLRSSTADQGSVVAAKGKWWAAWTAPDPGKLETLWQAHTMGTKTAAHQTLANDPGPIYDPALSLLTSSTVAMVWSSGYPAECPTLEWGKSSGAKKWTRSSSLKSCGRAARILVTGKTWRVVWLQRRSDAKQHVVFAQRTGSAAWSKHSFTHVNSGTHIWTPALSLAASGTSAAVGWTANDSHGISHAVAGIRRAGHWTETLLSAGSRAGVPILSVAGAIGLSGTNGVHAQLLLTEDDSAGNAFVRRQ